MSGGHCLATRSSTTAVIGTAGVAAELKGVLAAGTSSDETRVTLINGVGGDTLCDLTFGTSAATAAGKVEWVEFPGDGLYFSSGIAIGTLTGTRAVTVFYR